MSVEQMRATQLSIRVDEVGHADRPRVLEAHRLLRDVRGAGAVEDIGFFLETVSPETDRHVVPKLVCAVSRDRTIGVTVGAYLPELNIGFIAYSAVDPTWRRRGVYTAIRGRLVALFNLEAAERISRDSENGGRVSYVVSELDESSAIFRRYLTKWGAFVSPCAYEQPQAQGLRARRLKLVLQPVARQLPPDGEETVAIVREVYRRIYRISDVDANPSFRRVVASLPRASIGVA